MSHKIMIMVFNTERSIKYQTAYSRNEMKWKWGVEEFG